MRWVSLLVVCLTLSSMGSEATVQIHDADSYEDPLSKAVMECSDVIAPVIAEDTGRWLYVDLARTCCEDAALAVLQNRPLPSAFAAATKCFSRTLFPRSARATVGRLEACVRSVLVDEY